RNVIGKVLHLEDRTLRVVGVMPSDFIFPSVQGNRQPDVLVPLVDDSANPPGARARVSPPIGRLKAGVTIAQAQAEALAIARGVAPQTGASADLRPRLMGLREALFGNAEPVLLVLLGAAAFVLLIVCANLASLLLARGRERERELAVRSALGASRARLIRQLAIESLVLACVGGVAGLFIAYWTFDFVYALVPGRIYRMFPASIDLPRSRYSRPAAGQFRQRVLEQVANVPGVDAAAGAVGTPLMTSGWARLTFPRYAGGTASGFVWLVTANYFKTFGIRLLAGRTF